LVPRKVRLDRDGANLLTFSRGIPIDHLARQPFHPGASLLKNSNSASGPMTQRFIIR
jgi:hypothetical protein